MRANLRRLLMLSAIIFATAAPVTGAIKINKPAKRKLAPGFELIDASGNPVSLSSYAGKVVLIDFWATWCGPCQSSIPWLIEVADKYRGAGLAVIGIAMDEEGWPTVAPFMQKFHMTYPVLLGSKRVAYLYGGVEALPIAFFVDRGQRVAAIHPGLAHRDEFEKVLNALLNAGQDLRTKSSLR